MDFEALQLLLTKVALAGALAALLAYLALRFRAPPPETVRLTVGHWSVAVADAGDYVFLLGKGEGYDLDVEPYQSGVACFVTDDLGVPPRLLGGLAASAGAADDLQVSDTGEWTIDYGRVEWWMPSRGRPGYLLWLPMMWVDPGSWTVDDWLFREDCCTQDFEIVTFDVAPWAKPTGYRWQSQTREVYDIFAPDDWNGGSDFWDSAGARYYAPDETLCNVITGLLMYGYRAADGKLKRDIPAGSVEGVWQYGRAEGDSERSGVDAGIFKGYKTTRSPSHR